jgi:hypothetical protein
MSKVRKWLYSLNEIITGKQPIHESSFCIIYQGEKTNWFLGKDGYVYFGTWFISFLRLKLEDFKNLESKDRQYFK